MEPAGQVRLAVAGVTAREAEVLAVIGGLSLPKTPFSLVKRRAGIRG